MRVEIRVRRGQLDPVLGEQLERRLHFALARFGGRIRRIRAILEDINGPRGGEDQRCKIEVSLVPSGSIVAEAIDADIGSAVGHAAERVARRVRDALDRKRTLRLRTACLPDRDYAPVQGP